MAESGQETEDMQSNYSKWGTLIEDMGEKNSQGFLNQYIKHHHDIHTARDHSHRLKLQNLAGAAFTKKAKKVDPEQKTISIANMIVQPTARMEKALDGYKNVGNRMKSMRALLTRQTIVAKRPPGDQAGPDNNKASKND